MPFLPSQRPQHVSEWSQGRVVQQDPLELGGLSGSTQLVSTVDGDIVPWGKVPRDVVAVRTQDAKDRVVVDQPPEAQPLTWLRLKVGEVAHLQHRRERLRGERVVRQAGVANVKSASGELIQERRVVVAEDVGQGIGARVSIEHEDVDTRAGSSVGGLGADRPPWYEIGN